MKIDNSKPITRNEAETTRRSPTAKTGVRPVVADKAGTSVHLDSAAQLKALEHSIASAPVVDPKKVAEIKQAISEGRFQVNAGAVADGLLKTVNDLIAASQR